MHKVKLSTESQECETGLLTQRGNNTNRKRKAVGKGIAESGIPEKLHLPEQMRNFDFKDVSLYSQKKWTMDDIMDDGAPSNKKRRLIQRIQQRDPDTYEKDIESAPNRRRESDGLKQLKTDVKSTNHLLTRQENSQLSVSYVTSSILGLKEAARKLITKETALNRRPKSEGLKQIKTDVKSTKHQLTRQENRCSPSRVQVNRLATNLHTEGGLKGQLSVSPVNSSLLGLKEAAKKSIPKADVKSTKHQLTRQENRCSPSRVQVNGLAANLDTERGLKGQLSVSPVNSLILGLKEEARKSIPKASSVPDNLGLAAEHGELLGRGACGEVYKWYDSKSRTMMAVKKVPLYGSTIERGVAESLVNEIKILKRLNHDRIIRYYGCSEEETWIQIFMEYMPNGSLKDFMSKYHTPLEEEFVVKVTRQVIEGTAYLHENQILHRDIKASNVLLDSEMNAKLGDFGISKELHTLTNSSTHCNTHVGTPYWMSPERVRGEKYGRSADIWSIGCTVVEMITMKPPWCEFETNAAIFQIGLGVYPKYQLPSTVSQHVADLLSQTFQQEASKRPTALELLNHPFLR